MHKLLDMSLKSGLEVCWWDVLQPAQVMVGWGPEKKLFGAGGGGRAGTWEQCWGELGEGCISEKEETEDVV